MTLVSESSDDDLLRLLVAGSEDAFTELYRRRSGAIYRFALQMGGDRTIGEEVTQEVFLAVIRGATGYDPARGSMESWLFGVARNHVLRILERDRRYRPAEDGDDFEQVYDDRLRESLARDERLELVRRAVLALPPKYREVVVLCDLHELSYERAAGVLNCAIGTVRSRLSRGRSILADKLRALECSA
jgi:RNA polymerase sigma-70 factor (ECF subfamily)